MPCWFAVIPHLFCFSAFPSAFHNFLDEEEEENHKKISLAWLKRPAKDSLLFFFWESDTVSNYEITITPLTNLAQWHLYLKSIIQSLLPLFVDFLNPTQSELDSVASAYSSFFCNRKRFFYVLLVGVFILRFVKCSNVYIFVVIEPSPT